jgi:hypothetical protein
MVVAFLTASVPHGRNAMRTRLVVAVWVSLNLLAGSPILAESHVATAQSIEQRLSDKMAERERDLAAIQRLLVTREATSAIHALGASPADVRMRVYALGDSEVQDLARRARALECDPVAGVDVKKHRVLVAVLIGVVVIVALSAANWD